MNQQNATAWLDHTALAALLNRDEGQIASLCADLQTSTKPILEASQVRRALTRAGFRFPHKAQCLSLMMCKGGVGKTTVAFFLGQRLASYGAKVLYIDTDPQANLTAALRPDLSGFPLSDRTPVLLDVLAKRCPLDAAILPLNAQVHLLPSTAMNSMLEKQLVQAKSPPVREFAALLRSIEQRYDYILVDCAPSLNIINASIVYASDTVLLPFQLDEFSRLGLAQTVCEIKDLQNEFKFHTSVRLLLNKYQASEKLSLLYLGDVADKYKDILLQATIRQSHEIKSALTFRRDFFMRTNSKPRADFDRLAQTILNQSRQEVQIAEH